MRRRLRLALVACTGLLALAFAGPALAKYDPKLTVTSSGSQVTLAATLTEEDDPTARVTFYVPPGWSASLSQPAGTELGQVSAQVNALDLAPPTGLLVPVTGTVRAADPAGFLNNPCTRQATPHQAVWVLALTAGTTQLQPVPLYIDTVTGAEAAFSSLRITLCLPPRDVPQGTPGRATLGLKLVRATLTLNNVFTVGAANRWTALFIPYTPGSATPNVPNSAQSQSVTGQGEQLRITARKLRGRRARVAGRLTAGGEAVAGATVRILANGRTVATARTNANGSFSRAVRLTRTTVFRARATAAARETQGGCEPLLPLPTGGTARCTVVTIGAVSATSNSARLTVKKQQRRRGR